MRLHSFKYNISERRKETVKLRNFILLLLAVIMILEIAGCNNRADFDFDRAVNNITLFGSKISLPCTIADFGKNFSLKEENAAAFGDITSCSILYKGKSIGTVSLADCKEGDNLTNKQIISLSLGLIANTADLDDSIKENLYERNGWYSGLIEVDFGGLSFETAEADVKKLLGKPLEKDDGAAIYEHRTDDGKGYVKTEFYQGKVRRMEIYLGKMNNA